MRFDKLIGLYILEDIADGLGGHTEVEKFIYSRYASVEELSLETTIKIYGEAITQNVKAIVLGDIKEKRINTEITRKVCLVALTDSTKAVKITIA